MSMLRFTIREVLLGTTIAGMALGWSLDHIQLAKDLQRTETRDSWHRQEVKSFRQQISRMTLDNWRLESENEMLAAENTELKRRHDLFSRDEDVERLKMRFAPSLLRAGQNPLPSAASLTVSTGGPILRVETARRV